MEEQVEDYRRRERERERERERDILGEEGILKDDKRRRGEGKKRREAYLKWRKEERGGGLSSTVNPRRVDLGKRNRKRKNCYSTGTLRRERPETPYSCACQEWLSGQREEGQLW